MKYCLIEDSDRNRFAPFTILRPTDTLLMGMTTIYEKWKWELNSDYLFRLVPNDLAVYWLEIESLKADIFINSRYLPSISLAETISKLNVGQRIIDQNNDVIAIRPKTELSEYLPIEQIQYSDEIVLELNPHSKLNHIWEITTKNGVEINEDFKRFKLVDNRSEIKHHQVIIDGEYPVYIHESATLEPGVTLLAYDGPIVIQKNALIMSGTMIRGPVSVGESAILKMGGHIYGETSIGNHCRIGGEVKSAVFHQYSNKAHGGYIGNAVVGEWCNWGAHTNCSNLKNNYSQVSIPTFPNGEMIETGLQFLGVMMGDHTKTAINTSINTGSVFGVFCNIADVGFPPKFLPNFSWLVNGKLSTYSLDKAIETFAQIKQRRGLSLSENEITLFKSVFEKVTTPN